MFRYNINHQTPDSAATATAYLCGVKAQLGTIGVDGRAIRGDCPSSIGTSVSSILDWAQQAGKIFSILDQKMFLLSQGKKVGIITTTRITHATPSAAYAHVADRDWESYDTRNFGARQAREGCVDIALQLMQRSPPIDLIFGGGRHAFYPNTVPDVEYPTFNGSRRDNRSLINELWRGEYIWNKTAMDRIPSGTFKPILGLFERNHMYFESDRIATQNDEPSLSQMTKFAVEHFSKFNQGFFLLIEGGKIDHGHHTTQARYALDEFVELDNAIGQAKEILQGRNTLDETLMVVTADHSHVFTFGAYASRGSNILGFAQSKELNGSDVDQAPINIITYGNGPNFNSSRNRTHLSSLNTNSTTYLSPAALPLVYETHGGDDVPVFAQGPWSHLFTTIMEQSTIAHKMAYAACWGRYKNRTGCQSIIISTFPTKFNQATSFYAILSTRIFIISLLLLLNQ